MKLIGIIGSCGKTSVCEMLYQYLLFKGEAVSMYSSNGNFSNGLTRVKDYFQTTLYHKDLNQFLEEDKLNNVQYAIIEITAESVKRNDAVYALDYDVVALTNFYPNLHNHFESKEDYYDCKRRIIDQNKDKMVLLRIEEPNYSMFSDISHKTYGYAESADFQLTVNDNTINGLDLTYKGVSFTSNLLTAFHARNLACALGVLDYLKLLDMNIFSNYAKNIFIRGRFEKFNYQNKTIILDTGLVGVDMLLIGLERTLGNLNYKIIYSSVAYSDENGWVKRSRKINGDYLKRANHIYLTNPSNNEKELEIFLNDVVGAHHINYTYIADPKSAVSKAVSQLTGDEVLVICARNYYRQYRGILEEMTKEV